MQSAGTDCPKDTFSPKNEDSRTPTFLAVFATLWEKEIHKRFAVLAISKILGPEILHGVSRFLFVKCHFQMTFFHVFPHSPFPPALSWYFTKRPWVPWEKSKLNTYTVALQKRGFRKAKSFPPSETSLNVAEKFLISRGKLNRHWPSLRGWQLPFMLPMDFFFPPSQKFMSDSLHVWTASYNGCTVLRMK